jgi:hypothetical protein
MHAAGAALLAPIPEVLLSTQVQQLLCVRFVFSNSFGMRRQ